MSKNKIATAITLFLMFAITFSLIALPTYAHTPQWTVKTYAYLSVEPDPVGIGQPAFVNFWIDKAPPTAIAQYGDRWEGYEVTVTDPNGHKETLGPFTSDDAGGAHTTYTPAATGEYTFVFNFPGQLIEGSNPGPTGTYQEQYVGDYYEGSTSNEVTLVVQDEQIEAYPEPPLPTDYWQRPIYAENLGWYQISGNWLGFSMQSHGGAYYNISGNFNPYTTGPSSAHIIWTKPLAFGGIIGGEFGGNEYGSSYYSTPQYEPKFQGIVINGILYYKSVPGSSTYPEGWIAVNIRTGENVWTKETSNSFLCGQVLSYVSPNQFGGIPYLWSNEPTVTPNSGRTYGLYDATTGNWILNIVNGTSFSKIVEADDGSLLGYYTNNTDHTLNMWNSTKCIIGPTDIPAGYPVGWMWRPPQGGEVPFEYGIQWSAPVATTIDGETISPNLGITTLSTDAVLMTSSSGRFFQEGSMIMAGYDAKTGELLWGPKNRTFITGDRTKLSPAMQGMWFEFNHPTMTWSGYNLNNGQKVWGPSDPYPNPWGYYVAYDPIAAYGMLYQADFGGYVHAYDLNTGEVKWDFSTGESGYETPYGIYPLLHIEAIADGKIYVEGGHTYSPPLFRGSQLWCINATTGEKIWSVSSFVTVNQASAVLADGVLVEPNAYDNQLYAYSKGRSAITVKAPDTVQPFGNDVLVQGTVTDQSPGQTCLGIPAAGTPAIADECMSEWMEYLYMQQPKPSNATGVKVTVSVLDPNNNVYDVGTTTSNVDGKYGLTFVPLVPGQYTVIAMFEGSESYYSSTTTTYLSVSEAPPAASEPTPEPVSAADLYFLPVSSAIILAIVVIGLVLILMLRKR
jgi:hypothetical protein